MTCLRGTTVLLTGASGAIGGEVARRLMAHGARLALTGRQEERLRVLANELSPSGDAAPVVLPADLGQAGAARALADQATSALGHVDVVVNNAGVTMQGLLWMTGDGDQARELFETNLWSPLALVAALAPGMIERGHGVIVNIGSMAAVSPLPRLGAYAASRAALATVTDVMRQELAPRGVRVTEVVLGPIESPSGRQGRVAGVGTNERILGSLDGAAETIVNAVGDGNEGVVFFPRMLGWSRGVPVLTRVVTRVLARGADVEDTSVQFGRPAGPGDSPP